MDKLLKVLELPQEKTFEFAVKLVKESTEQQRIMLVTNNSVESKSMAKKFASKAGKTAIVNEQDPTEVFVNGFHYVQFICKSKANYSLYKLINDTYTAKVRLF